MSSKALFTLTVLSAALGLQGIASAQTNLVKNGSFEDLTVPLAAGGQDWFSSVLPKNWSISAPTYGAMIDAPGAEANPVYLQVWPGFPATSPDGGNFYKAWADATYARPISQTVTGLVPGQVYQLSFLQAAGTDNGQTQETHSQWNVSFGSTTQTGALMTVPSKSYVPWMQQTMTFTATSASEVLSFIATGGPTGAPPVAFLDGISVTAVPEPTTTALLLAGIIGVAFIARRRRPD